MLERVFHLTENETTVRRELLAGLTTFMTMAYVVVVNPRILAEGGMPVEGVLFATCISAALATLVMGLWANYPIALAPGMSLNAYFTYSIVIGRGVPWQTALGVVFLSGLLFLLLTLTNVREHIVNGIPDCLKHGTAAGIGLFIAFVGLRNAKIIVANPATFVAFGKTSDPQVLLAAAGLILIAILMIRKVGSAILLGIVAIALAGIPLGLSHWPTQLFSWPHPAGTFLKLDLRSATRLGLGELIFVFFFVDLFDNVGTLVGVCEQGGFLRDGKLPRASRALLADAFRNAGRRAHRHIHGDKLHRKRCGRGGRSTDGAGESGDRRAFFRGDVLRAAGRRDSFVRDGARSDSGRRADVQLNRESSLGRFQRRFSRVPHAGGDAADVQHRHGTEPGLALFYVPEDRRRKIPGHQSTYMGVVGDFPAAFRISWLGVALAWCSSSRAGRKSL